MLSLPFLLLYLLLEKLHITHKSTTKKMTFTLQPVVPNAKQTGVDFGAIVEDLDLETISRMFSNA